MLKVLLTSSNIISNLSPVLIMFPLSVKGNAFFVPQNRIHINSFQTIFVNYVHTHLNIWLYTSVHEFCARPCVWICLGKRVCVCVWFKPKGSYVTLQSERSEVLDIPLVSRQVFLKSFTCLPFAASPSLESGTHSTTGSSGQVGLCHGKICYATCYANTLVQAWPLGTETRRSTRSHTKHIKDIPSRTLHKQTSSYMHAHPDTPPQYLYR